MTNDVLNRMIDLIIDQPPETLNLAGVFAIWRRKGFEIREIAEHGPTAIAQAEQFRRKYVDNKIRRA